MPQNVFEAYGGLNIVDFEQPERHVVVISQSSTDLYDPTGTVGDTVADWGETAGAPIWDGTENTGLFIYDTDSTLDYVVLNKNDNAWYISKPSGTPERILSSVDGDSADRSKTLRFTTSAVAVTPVNNTFYSGEVFLQSQNIYNPTGNEAQTLPQNALPSAIGAGTGSNGVKGGVYISNHDAFTNRTGGTSSSTVVSQQAMSDFKSGFLATTYLRKDRTGGTTLDNSNVSVNYSHTDQTHITASGALTLDGTTNTTINSSTTFTSSNITTSARVRIPNGTVTAPSLSFSSDTDTGLYRASANDMRFVSGGANRLRITNGVTYNYNTLRNSNGNASSPAYTFTSDIDTGMFRSGTNGLGFSTGGNIRGNFNSAGLQIHQNLLVSGSSVINGIATFNSRLRANMSDSASSPAYSFDGDTDTGMYNNSANMLGFSTNGVERLSISTTTIKLSSNATVTGNLTVTGGNVIVGVANSGSSNIYVDTIVSRDSSSTRIDLQASTNSIRFRPSSSETTSYGRVDTTGFHTSYYASAVRFRGSSNTNSYMDIDDADLKFVRSGTQALGIYSNEVRVSAKLTMNDNHIDMNNNKITELQIPTAARDAANKEYVDNSTVNLTPIGGIIIWANGTPPTGWIECNGQVTSGYTDLILVVGSNVPDLRGQFVRGWANTSTVDSGRGLKSAQSYSYQSHSHDATSTSVNLGTKPTSVQGAHTHSRGTMEITGAIGSDDRLAEKCTGAFTGDKPGAYSGANGAGAGGRATFTASRTWSGTTSSSGGHSHTVALGSHSHDVTVNNSGIDETRPTNVALMYIIRAF